MQIDLQKPLNILNIWLNDTKVNYTNEGNVWWVQTNNLSKLSGSNFLKIEYEGKPQIAKRPPWDGGLIYSKDSVGNPFFSITCEGLGASVWYPCKDHLGDEPNKGAKLHITAPNNLKAIGNGRLINTEKNGENTTYTWQVKNPINTYNIIPYIGNYVHFSDTIIGAKGVLDLDYYVLPENLEKAKEQFKQAKSMLHCFEHWFGPYPFYNDGFKMIEAPHLGMEHQSAIAYGNRYQNGYRGTDRSGSGWGLKWDFIIIHESGHEWFGNNISTADHGDMWIHESFTNYSETLYTEWLFGKKAGSEYSIGQRKIIRNTSPIIGPYDVNGDGSGDMYDKGGSMIHLIRQIVNNDGRFRGMLRTMNQRFFHNTTRSIFIERFINEYTKHDFSKVFDQYLRTTKIPKLNHSLNGKKLTLKFTNVVPGFKIPIRIPVSATKYKRITIGEKSTTIHCKLTESELVKLWDKNYYVEY
jgi:aminopeptidase N